MVSMIILMFVLSAGLILGPIIVLAIDAKGRGVVVALQEFSPFGVKYCVMSRWSDAIKEMYVKALEERYDGGS